MEEYLRRVIKKILWGFGVPTRRIKECLSKAAIKNHPDNGGDYEKVLYLFERII